jgi:hypothetical protein
LPPRHPPLQVSPVRSQSSRTDPRQNRCSSTAKRECKK